MLRHRTLGWQHQDRTRVKRIVPLPSLTPKVKLFRRPDCEDKPMPGRGRQTVFNTVGHATVTNRLERLPSHSVARRARDKRDELLPCLQFLETVSLLLHMLHCDKSCSAINPASIRIFCSEVHCLNGVVFSVLDRTISQSLENGSSSLVKRSPSQGRCMSSAESAVRLE